MADFTTPFVLIFLSLFFFPNDGIRAVAAGCNLLQAAARGDVNAMKTLLETRRTDVNFRDYATNADVATAVAELTALSDFRGPKSGGLVTPDNLFRSPTPGDLAGPRSMRTPRAASAFTTATVWRPAASVST